MVRGVHPRAHPVSMMLTEPGARVDGPAEEVLEAIFDAIWNLLSEAMSDDSADKLALRLMGRIHGELADTGLITRQVEDAWTG